MIPDKVFFRVDSSLHIGSGHIMRCLTLATALKKKGVASAFVSRAHAGNLSHVVHEAGYQVLNLPNETVTASRSTKGYEHWLGAKPDIDAEQTLGFLNETTGISWLVTDHYGIDESWENIVRPAVRKIVSLDDLANRTHDCDLLIDSSYQRECSEYYELVPRGAQTLTGTSYCLLREEFAKARKYVRKKSIAFPLKHILISLGGVDLDNSTALVIDEIEKSHLPDCTSIDVVIGPTSPHYSSLCMQARKSRLNINVHQGIKNMAERLLATDLCIGAVGGSTWERCCLGCPSVVASIATNQDEGSEKLESAGVVTCFQPTVAGQLQAIIEKLCYEKLESMSQRGLSLVDGLGADRVTTVMLEQE